MTSYRSSYFISTFAKVLSLNQFLKKSWKKFHGTIKVLPLVEFIMHFEIYHIILMVLLLQMSFSLHEQTIKIPSQTSKSVLVINSKHTNKLPFLSLQYTC